MLVKSYQFTGIDFGHLGQVDPNNMKQSGTFDKRRDFVHRVICIKYNLNRTTNIHIDQ